VKVTIRPATEADLPALVALYGQLDASMYAPQDDADEATRLLIFREIEDDPRQHFLVAEASGRLVGAAHLVVLQHFDRELKRSALVEDVVVAEDYRRKGVGAALMRRLAEIARKAGCYKLMLSSNLARRGAHRFYSRLGWKRTHYGFSVDL
jgi:GNAT superfamily N-acetyltransferase